MRIIFYNRFIRVQHFHKHDSLLGSLRIVKFLVFIVILYSNFFNICRKSFVRLFRDPQIFIIEKIWGHHWDPFIRHLMTNLKLNIWSLHLVPFCFFIYESYQKYSRLHYKNVGVGRKKINITVPAIVSEIFWILRK